MIMKLPEEPVIYVVYNANMVSHVEQLIIEHRGKEFLDKYVNVMSKDKAVANGSTLYFDPNLFNLIGNGYD
jgi:hypothetical protein